MRCFGLLLMLVLAVVALAICGPPAVDAGHSDYLTLQNSIAVGPVAVAESPATAPAPLLVVADPGSRSGMFATVASTRLNFVPITRRAAEFQRWRCRLLIRSAACG